MTLHKNLGDISLFLLGPEDAGVAWQVLRRSQVMRIVPAIENRDAVVDWLEQGTKAGNVILLSQDNANDYPLGLVCIGSRMLNRVSTRVLAYSFDRCIAGRDRALQSIRTVEESFSLVDSVCLFGPAMANSERVAKALGFILDSVIQDNAIDFKLYRYPPR